MTRLLARGLAAVVRLYQLIVAPWLPPSCRFTPSCSAYMIEALKTHGAWRGLVLGLKRIGRCSPLTPSGFDPVPPPKGGGDDGR